MAITRTVTVTAGRFAPGHLGELTTVMPFELVDAVLAETRSVQKRLRDLPLRVGIYFLLAMCLFPEVGYRLVWDKLTAGLADVPVASPTPKALRDLRRRLGGAPVWALFEVLAGACGPADDTRRAVRALPDCVIRRLQFPEGPRLRAKQGLAGADLPSRLSHTGVDDAGRDRHTGLARRGVRAHRRG
ncbi:transposase domain-containing protein [Streptomyces sp. 8P21H-1]|uniref:transposase domain-containing protein n=1 Tax=Streptomyces sp. 8P21H-1 TaxID=2737048 RepID=UPI001C2D8AB4|nr:transposase domain-containing protein [Streptomyces sp. 8P21H-1]